MGLGIELPVESGVNPWVDHGNNIRSFFAITTMFVKYAHGFVVLPGGLGTLDELFEAMVLVQTGKVTSFPIVLVGSAFWGPLLDWLRDTLVGNGMISPADMDLIQVADTPEDAVSLVLAGFGADERRGGMFGSAEEEDWAEGVAGGAAQAEEA